MALKSAECQTENRENHSAGFVHTSSIASIRPWECGWGVSSRDGSRWKSVGVIGSQQQRVFVVVGSCRESLGAIGSHSESLGAIGVNFPTKVSVAGYIWAPFELGTLIYLYNDLGVCAAYLS